ncbi:MAG: peptide deformylase [Persicimonas sp.]
MTIREIVLYPEARDVLTTECTPIEEVDEQTKQLVDDLVETMYEAQGVGLAAPQIGVTKRVTVIDIRDDEGEKSEVFVLINPEIVEREGKLTWEEGCLSFPGLYGDVERSNWVKVRALNRDGEPYEIEGEGLLAVALQHEIDHLDGVLFTHRMSGLKRRLALKEYKKIRARQAEEEAEEGDEEAAQ